METNFNTQKRSNAKVAMGLILIAFGGLLFGRNFGLDIPYWLIMMGVVSGIKHQFKRPGPYVLILVGSTFLIEKLVPGFDLHEAIFPLIITFLGVFLILKRDQHPFGHCQHWREFRHLKETRE